MRNAGKVINDVPMEVVGATLTSHSSFSWIVDRGSKELRHVKDDEKGYVNAQPWTLECANESGLIFSP